MAGRYKLSATLDAKYAPLINCSRMLDEQTPKLEFPILRDRGATIVDLWTDSSIYPHHPASNTRPRFRTVSELLEFVGDGKCGLLGYIESLCKSDSSMQYRLLEAEREILSMRDQLQVLMHIVEERDKLLKFFESEVHCRERLVEQNQVLLLANELLKGEVSTLSEENQRMIFAYEDRLRILGVETAELNKNRWEMELEFWIEIESLKECHSQKLSTIALELKRTKATLRRRENRLSNLIKTPYGYRSTVRDRKDLSTLAPGGGHAKRTMRLARSIIVPATTRHIQSSNNASGSRQRLWGSKDTQSQTGRVLASLLSQTEVTAICEDPKLSVIGVRMANYYLNKIGEQVGATDILETCDRNGITHSGYGAIYKRFKGAARVAGRGIRVGCLPNPYQVSIARKMLNLKLVEYVGEYYSLNETLVVAPTAKSSNKEPMKVCLNEMNSIFVDVEQVQRTMVLLYGFTEFGKPTSLIVHS